MWCLSMTDVGQTAKSWRNVVTRWNISAQPSSPNFALEIGLTAHQKTTVCQWQTVNRFMSSYMSPGNGNQEF